MLFRVLVDLVHEAVDCKHTPQGRLQLFVFVLNHDLN